MQKQLTNGRLLNNEGNLNEAGYAFSLVREYSRKDIKHMAWRIKEWDYYEFNSDEYGVALTVADNSYMSLVSVSLLDFKKKTFITKSYMKGFTFGKLNLPSTSEKGDIVYEDKNSKFEFLNNGKERHLKVWFKNFRNNEDFNCDFKVIQSTDKTMVIATPFSKKRHFYYNQKINNLVCNGVFSIGNEKHQMKDNLGVLDWGRGVWTYNNTWYWSSCSQYDKDKNKIGFNLGYGFGDTSAASENMVFFNKEAYKLEDVEFIIPKNKEGKYEYLKPWKIVSKNKDIDLVFTPLIDRCDNTDVGIICSLQHQVFGKFKGKIQIKGKNIAFNDVIGFAERVTNRW